MKFANPHALWLIPCLLVFGFALFRWSRRIARKKLASFGPPERLPRILRSVDGRAAARKFWLAVCALCLVAVSIARSFERLEERIDASESRLYSRLADLEDRVEACRQDIADDIGTLRDEVRELARVDDSE